MAGGNHFDAGGGFSGGGAEDNEINGENGLGGGKKSYNLDDFKYDSGCGGGGYYSTGYGKAIIEVEQTLIGGRGGGPGMEQSGGVWTTTEWYKDLAGDGGEARLRWSCYLFKC